MCTREEDLAEWEKIEREFGELLLQRNPWTAVEYSTWAFSDYDLILIKQDRTKYSFEVKYDRMSDITGNIAVEISCNGHPSGITISKADWFAYYFGNNYWLIKWEELRAKIREAKTIMGWDWYRAELVLIPKKTFISRCIKIWH